MDETLIPYIDEKIINFSWVQSMKNIRVGVKLAGGTTSTQIKKSIVNSKTKISAKNGEEILIDVRKFY
jgi:hypothetical protein